MTTINTIPTIDFQRHVWSKPHQLTSHIDDEGKIWFVAKEVCDLLGIQNTTQMAKALDEDQVRLIYMDSIGIYPQKRQQEINLISESGLYHMIFLSKKPGVRRFRRWITDVVIPSIRLSDEYICMVSKSILKRQKLMIVSTMAYIMVFLSVIYCVIIYEVVYARLN